jgi:hypothetical protein
MRPTLFVGSSSEGLSVAYAAQLNLEDIAEVIVWKQGIFDLTKFYLESLIDALKESEFGLFIFHPDDVAVIRGEQVRTARDNVVFELGLFVGRLGRERTFVVMPRGVPEFHLPTDLLGVSVATYAPPERPDRLQAALGPACYRIQQVILREQGAARPQEVPKTADMGLLLSAVIPEPERAHLLNIAQKRTRGYKGNGSLRSELRHLRTLGLIDKVKGRHIGDLTTGSVFDLADFVELTESGKQWAAKLQAPA